MSCSESFFCKTGKVRGVTLSEGIPSDDITRQGCCSSRQTDGVGVVVYLKRRRFKGSWDVVVTSVESLPPLPGTVTDHPGVPAHPFRQLRWYGHASLQWSTFWVMRGHESERTGRARQEAQRQKAQSLRGYRRTQMWLLNRNVFGWRRGNSSSFLEGFLRVYLKYR